MPFKRELTPVRDGTYKQESPDGSDDWYLKVANNGDEIHQMSTSNREWVEIGSLSFWGFRLYERQHIDVINTNIVNALTMAISHLELSADPNAWDAAETLRIMLNEYNE